MKFREAMEVILNQFETFSIFLMGDVNAHICTPSNYPQELFKNSELSATCSMSINALNNKGNKLNYYMGSISLVNVKGRSYSDTAAQSTYFGKVARPTWPGPI